MSAIPVVTLHGSAFERGRQHGGRFRSEIASGLTAARAAQSDAVYRAARRRAESASANIRLAAPEVAEELEGLAVGAGSDPIDILLRSGFEFFAASPPGGCSAIAACGDGGALVAQNWDAPPALASELALFLHFGPAGLEQAIVGSLGMLGWVGCNRHGLAFVNNDLMLSSTASGLPSQIVRRLILRERTVPAALDLLRRLPHMGGRSYLLGDAAGRVAGVEVAAGIGARVNQTESPVLHTNHALDRDVAADQSEAELQAIYPSSRHRYDVLRKRAGGRLDSDAIAAMLADEEGHPNSIAKAASAAEPSATLFSVIFDCGGRSLLLCRGAPVHQDYQRVAW